MLRAFGILLLVLLMADFFFGNSWANGAKRLLHKFSEILLVGALMEPYHRKVRGMLDLADRRIGRVVPTVTITAAVFASFGALFLSAGLVQAIQEHTHLASGFFRDLLVYCLGATASTFFCYTVTYLVLYSIDSGLRPFVPKYLYLVSLEVFVSYFLAPLGYASLFLVNDCPIEMCGELYDPTMRDRIRAFGGVVSRWPSSVVAAGYEYVYNFQSAANFVLLHLSMLLCVLPTVAHVGMLVADLLRFILKHICENLMDVFDRLASGPAPFRRFLLGVLSILSVLGWLLG